MILAAVRKECLQLLADRGALATMFLMPLAFIAFFGLVFRPGGGDGDQRARPIAVWHATDHALGRAIVANIEASGQLSPVAMDSAEAVRRSVADERVDVGLVIPPDFDPASGRPAHLIIDPGASLMFRGPVQGAVTALVERAVAPPNAAPPAYVDVQAPPGVREPLANIDSFQVTVPGNALLFSFFIAVTVALGFVEERRVGTFRRLLASPVSRPRVLLAKLVPYFLVGLVQMAFLFGVGIVGFGMAVAGSALALCALTAASVFCAVSLGLFIASFGGTEKQVGGFASLAVLVMGLIGGAMYPRALMPESMQTLGLLVPHGWGLDGYYDVLVRAGTTVGDIAPHICAMCAFGAAFAVFGALRFRFE